MQIYVIKVRSNIVSINYKLISNYISIYIFIFYVNIYIIISSNGMLMSASESAVLYRIDDIIIVIVSI